MDMYVYGPPFSFYIKFSVSNCAHERSSLHYSSFRLPVFRDFSFIFGNSVSVPILNLRCVQTYKLLIAHQAALISSRLILFRTQKSYFILYFSGNLRLLL
jgi:hypothetical protein